MTLKKLFILLLLSNTWLFGCALCNLKRPIVHVSTEVSTKDDLVNLHITWEMAKDFSIEVVRSFDINGNEIYEQQELYELQKILELYLIPHHYLTFIKTSQNNKTIDIDFKVTNASVRYDYGKSLLYYSYDISLQKKQLKNSFGIKFYDSQKYFDLLLYDFNSDIFNTNNLQRTTNSLTLFFDNNSTELFSETMETKIKKNIIVEALSHHLNNLKE
ncbi:MAG: DUF1007 family protein, partial [Arcobacter sp.]|nr:DUF1007 family protein [Arcobacter sp.]